MSLKNQPKALLTDVFGTVVDWRSTVTNFLTRTAEDTLNSSSSSIPSSVRTAAASISWPDFAQAWRTSYYHFTRSYDPSSGNFRSVDQHHLESLIKLVKENGIDGLWDEEQLKKNSMIWHFLDPWSDSAKGLDMLNRKFETCTLSNGNTTLLSDLAKHGNLPYKHIISAEEFKAYKPHPNVYNGAAKRLGLKTSECALIAAHLNDLEAAKGQGYQTIYIERSREEGWDDAKVEEVKKAGWVDMWVSIDEPGFEEVARRFGCDGSSDTKMENKTRTNTTEEENVRRGIYHEDGSILGTDSGNSGHQQKVESDAQRGIYHDDLSITQ